MEIIPFDKRIGFIWYNGEFVEWQNATTHVLNHGLHYASCVFEGVRVYGEKIYKLEFPARIKTSKHKELDPPRERAPPRKKTHLKPEPESKRQRQCRRSVTGVASDGSEREEGESRGKKHSWEEIT